MTAVPNGPTGPAWAPRIAFPWRPDGRGRTASCSEEQHVRQLIEQVLLTAPGERVMRPDFGGGLLQRVFEPNGPELLATTRYLVQAALERHLGGRVGIDRLEVEARDELLLVTVSWTLLRTDAGNTSTVSVTTGGTG
jgi:hypothetical protein